MNLGYFLVGGANKVSLSVLLPCVSSNHFHCNMFPQKKCFLTLHPLFVHSILGVAEVDNCSSDDVISVMVVQRGWGVSSCNIKWSIADNGVGYGDKFGMA